MAARRPADWPAVTRLDVVLGDITRVEVDAVVNAADRRMRGGGGVDGAIHRAGGPAVLADCEALFPQGLATGDAGSTTAGDLPARWVIHTAGPDQRAGQKDPAVLASCFRRCLEVADHLGARSLAVPLVGAGVFGWPLQQAVDVAVTTLSRTATHVEHVRVVAHDDAAHEAVRSALSRQTPLKLLQGVRELHRRGHHDVRAIPAISPSGMHWRLLVTSIEALDGTGLLLEEADAEAIHYSTGMTTEFADTRVTLTTTPAEVASAVLRTLPHLVQDAFDPGHAAWFEGLVHLVERTGELPAAYSDFHFNEPTWPVGTVGGRSVRYPAPLPPPGVSAPGWDRAPAGRDDRSLG